MRLAGFEFSPPWWATLLFFVVLALLVALGSWQVQRGQAKDEIIDQRTAAGKMPAVELDAALKKPDPGRQVTVQGRYLADRQLLLDNQVWQGRPGYRVWTPLRQDDGRLVIVDRGWVALGEDRREPPKPAVPEGVQTVSGYWRPWPQPGLVFAPPPCKEGEWSGPRVVLYPDFAQVACNYESPVMDGLLLLDEATAGGFPRDWQSVGMPPTRHYGYALQWYALALALSVIFIVMNTKKRRNSQ